MLGLALIATGTGGFKPCVAAFGGDQVINLKMCLVCNLFTAEKQFF